MEGEVEERVGYLYAMERNDVAVFPLGEGGRVEEVEHIDADLMRGRGERGEVEGEHPLRNWRASL